MPETDIPSLARQLIAQVAVVRPPREWEQITGIFIRDADGWDRKNFQASWSELITLEEFRNRAAMSTCEFPTQVDSRTPIRYDKRMDKGKLREQIETKIEEYKESRESHYAEHSTEGIMAFLNDTGIISGLRIALDLLEES